MNAILDDELDQVTGGSQLPYLVQPGDTLAKLAAKYHCTVDDLCRWNNIKNPDTILVGQKLIIRF